MPKRFKKKMMLIYRCRYRYRYICKIYHHSLKNLQKKWQLWKLLMVCKNMSSLHTSFTVFGHLDKHVKGFIFCFRLSSLLSFKYLAFSLLITLAMVFFPSTSLLFPLFLLLCSYSFFHFFSLYFIRSSKSVATYDLCF